MNKKSLLAALLAIKTIFSPCSYAMESPKKSQDTTGQLSSFFIGIVSQYLPLKSKEKLCYVNKKSALGAEYQSGYIDEYFKLHEIISKLPKTNFGYEIRNIDEFLEVYYILKKHNFKILCIEDLNLIESNAHFKINSDLKNFFDEISIKICSNSRRGPCIYIILPRSYTPSRDLKLNDDQEKHIKLLKQMEKIFDDKLCKPIFSHLSIWKLFELHELKKEIKVAKEKKDEDLIQKLEDFDNLSKLIDIRLILSEKLLEYKKRTRNTIELLIESGDISHEYHYTDDESKQYYSSNSSEYKDKYAHPMYQLFYNYLYDNIGSLAGQPHEIFKKNFDTAINYIDIVNLNKMKSIISSDWYLLSNNDFTDDYCRRTRTNILKNLEKHETALDFAKNLLYVYRFIEHEDNNINRMLNWIKQRDPVNYEKTFGKIINEQNK